MQPWEQQQGEPHRWYTRFRSYLIAGPGRTLEGTWKNEVATSNKKTRGKRLPGSWREQADKWRWKDRAECWDDYQLELEQNRWEQRRHDVREMEFQTAFRLLETAYRILDRVDLDNCHVRDVARMADIGSKLARLSTGLSEDGLQDDRLISLADIIKAVSGHVE